MPGRFDLDVTTIGELLDDPAARAIIDEIVPEVPGHPMVGMVKGMPANTVLAMAGGRLPAEKAAELKERISAL
jgi:prephenate dehydrogenase